ncbi:MAG: hypothetical protein AAF371_16110 [Pseudomonadota bacterium]
MHTTYRFAGMSRAFDALAMLLNERLGITVPRPVEVLSGAVRLAGRGLRLLAAYAAPKCQRIDRCIVEVVLVVQAACFLMLAAVAPFGGFGLPAGIALFLVVQTAWVILVLEAVRRDRPFLAACSYVPLVAVTFLEALRFGGLVGLVFALEAVLSVVAVYFLFTLPGRLARRSVTTSAP